tara:strand:- start:1212 stop:1334 length:123 start_codon:yes stop_codon:yes gene_type:complete
MYKNNDHLNILSKIESKTNSTQREFEDKLGLGKLNIYEIN